MSSNRISASADAEAQAVVVRQRRRVPPSAKARSRRSPRAWPVLASLRDFALAGLRPTTPLQRTIVAALVLKLLVVLSMQAFVAFDGPRTASSDRAIARVIGVEQPQP